MRKSNIQSVETHQHQNQDDPPPAYTGYAFKRPPSRPAILRDEQHLETPHSYSGSTNGYDHTVYNQGSIRQYAPYQPQLHLQHQYFQNAPAPDGPEYAAMRASSQHLRKPIVIPATTASLGSPFLRAYPPSLEAFQIRRTEFLDILDGLNRVAVQSPPLHALGLAGEVLQVVPVGTAQAVGLAINVAAQAVGLAINVAAQVGRVALSRGATEAYLWRVNKEIFTLRGLKIEIAKLDAVARVNNFPILDA